jgi:hypothetical protein
MKKMILFLLLFVSITAISGYSQSEGFGIGVILGEPTGLSGKYWLDGSRAIDGGAAWSFGNNGALHLHGDLLFHKYDLFKVSSGKLPLYYGIGGRVHFGDKTRLGVRVPVGVSYIFPQTPLDIFFELVPILDLAPSTSFNFNGALGLRYYF